MRCLRNLKIESLDAKDNLTDVKLVASIEKKINSMLIKFIGTKTYVSITDHVPACRSLIMPCSTRGLKFVSAAKVHQHGCATYCQA